jgi:hypothetical protein
LQETPEILKESNKGLRGNSEDDRFPMKREKGKKAMKNKNPSFALCSLVE